jgi:hypothetical protein
MVDDLVTPLVIRALKAWRKVRSGRKIRLMNARPQDIFFGGVCLIQAKRWTGLVGLEAVHALTGVMADRDATTGVLVATSWCGRPASSSPTGIESHWLAAPNSSN